MLAGDLRALNSLPEKKRKSLFFFICLSLSQWDAAGEKNVKHTHKSALLRRPELLHFAAAFQT